MKNILTPCAAIFLLSVSIAGTTPIPSGNNAYTTRDISEPYGMLPPRDFAIMDLWDGVGDDLNRHGVIDEGLASRSTNSTVRGGGSDVPLPPPPTTNGANGGHTSQTPVHVLPPDWTSMTTAQQEEYRRNHNLPPSPVVERESMIMIMHMDVEGSSNNAQY
ncbi:hypothetical protein H0H93_008170 [Arthromyces matolae]|nr:hypothetical protein H0H93_008170 [Arthromyces matolae]